MWLGNFYVEVYENHFVEVRGCSNQRDCLTKLREADVVAKDADVTLRSLSSVDLAFKLTAYEQVMLVYEHAMEKLRPQLQDRLAHYNYDAVLGDEPLPSNAKPLNLILSSLPEDLERQFIEFMTLRLEVNAQRAHCMFIARWMLAVVGRLSQVINLLDDNAAFEALTSDDGVTFDCNLTEPTAKEAFVIEKMTQVLLHERGEGCFVFEVLLSATTKLTAVAIKPTTGSIELAFCFRMKGIAESLSKALITAFADDESVEENDSLSASVVNLADLLSMADGSEEMEIELPGKEKEVVPPFAPELPTIVFRSQEIIADELLYQTLRVLNFNDMNALSEAFDSFNYLIMVPKFNTLRQQTMDRVMKFEDLIDIRETSGWTVGNSVMMYPVADQCSKMQMADVSKEILSNQRMLFVLVVDECHYAPTSTAIPLLHDERLHNCKNFVVVLISATPFNCLSVNSRVSEENRIVWSKVLDNDRQASTYIGFEFYARSIAFRCPTSHCFIRIKRRNGHGCVDIDLPSLRNREFASYDTLLSLVASEIRDRLQEQTNASHDIALQYLQDRCHFTFIGANSSSATVTLGGGEGIMKLLGFDGDVEIVCDGSKKTISAVKQISIDDAFPLHAQHYRSDQHFVRIKKLMEGKFPVLKNANSRGKNKGTLPPSDTSKLAYLREYRDNSVSTHKCLGNKPLLWARNGFIVVLDYILSLAYFSVTRSAAIAVDGSRAKRYIHTLVECCFYEDELNQCDLLQMLDTALKEMIAVRKAELEIAGKDAEDYLVVIESIIVEKQQLEHEVAVADQTWYTESDRVIKMLLEQKDPCPMALLRVYDNDENLSMQRILRHALKVCFGNKNNGIPPFSIIGDISGTNLYQAMEPYFKKHFSIQHELFGTQNSGTFAELLSLKSRLTKTAAELNYEDLAGLPCLIILCEKGRMGDTFPPQLRVLDMRMRTSNTGTTLIQELGRMCRYLNDSGEVASPNNDDGEFGNGLMVKDGASGVFLAVAETKEQWSYLVEQHRGKSLCYSKLQYPLPYALMSDEMMKVIRIGVDERETAIAASKLLGDGDNEIREFESKRRQHVVVDHLRFGSLDEYLVQNKALTTAATFKLRKCGTRLHYDVKNSTRMLHQRRLLLSAECQIGKTGSYLSYLSHLAARLNFSDGLLSPRPPLISSTLLPQHFLYPYWRDMMSQAPLDYKKPHKGKYMRHLAMQRLLCALYSASSLTPQDRDLLFRAKYQHCIKRLEYPASAAGQQQLDKLPNIFPFLLDRTHDKIETLVDFEVLETYIDWDGRMRNGIDKNGTTVNFASEVIREMQEDLSFYYEKVSKHGFDKIGQLLNNSFWDLCDSDSDDDDHDIKDISTSYGSAQLLAASPNDRNSCALSVLELQRLGSNSICSKIVPIRIADRFEVQVSIPDHICSEAGDGKFDFRDWCQRNRHPKVIKSWIFTPSVIDKHGQRYKYLLRKKCFEPSVLWQDYVQVLVVRSSQFTMYRDYYGGDYLIITLPDNMEVDQLLFRVEDGGAGFARRFIQLLAEWLGLNAIWMIDDNVRSCYQLYGDKEDRGNSLPQSQSQQSIKFGNIAFADVMIHIERIFYDGEEKNGLLRSVEHRFGKAPRIEEALLRRRMGPLDENTYGEGENGRDYIGCQNHYGVIGMARELQYRNRRIVHPIKVTHSVYSFYLFNVAAAKQHGLYYPPRKTMEDIEMNFMLEESGLVVCKLQKFCHLKPARSARNAAQLQAESEVLCVLQNYLGPASEGRYAVSQLRRGLFQPDQCPDFRCIEQVLDRYHPNGQSHSSSDATIAIVYLAQAQLNKLKLDSRLKDLYTLIIHEFEELLGENVIFIVNRDEIDCCLFSQGRLLRYDFHTIRCTLFTTLSEAHSKAEEGGGKLRTEHGNDQQKVGFPPQQQYGAPAFPNSEASSTSKKRSMDWLKTPDAAISRKRQVKDEMGTSTGNVVGKLNSCAAGMSTKIKVQCPIIVIEDDEDGDVREPCCSSRTNTEETVRSCQHKIGGMELGERVLNGEPEKPMDEEIPGHTSSLDNRIVDPIHFRGHVPNTLSSFFLFKADQLEVLKGRTEFGEGGKIAAIGQMWQDLPPNERERYNQRAQVLKNERVREIFDSVIGVMRRTGKPMSIPDIRMLLDFKWTKQYTDTEKQETLIEKLLSENPRHFVAGEKFGEWKLANP